MRMLYFDIRMIANLLGCGLLLASLVSCVSSIPPDSYLELNNSSSGISSESAAMEAFARAHLLSIDGDFEGSLEAIQQAIEIDPDSAFLHLSKAEILLHLGQLDRAEVALKDALLLDPDLLDAYLILSELETARGDHAAAAGSLAIAWRLQPDDHQIGLYLALAHARNQDITSSVAILEQLVNKTPDYLDARLALARIHQLSNFPLLAVEAYRDLLKIDPEHEQATLELGNLYLEINQPDKAVSLFVDFIKVVPDSSRIRYQLVRFYLDQNSFESALEQLSEIAAYDPDDLDALHKIGLIRLQQNRPDLAVQVFREVLLKNPGAEAYYALGIALEENGEWGEAIVAFEQIDADSKHSQDAVVHRAYLLPKLDRSQDAIILLETQLTVLEPVPALYEYLASLYGTEKDWTKALQTLNTGLDQFPDNTSLLMRQALLLDLAGKPAPAHEAAQRVLEIEPNNAEALNFIAYSYALRNIHLDEAESLVLKALELSDAPHIRDTYGWVLFKQKRFDEALVQLEIASTDLPEDSTIHEHLGDLYTVLGRLDDALAAYQKSLASKHALDPAAIQQKIDSLKVDIKK